jgi:Ni/Fe-hydrogenase subunit HybB-like protein
MEYFIRPQHFDAIGALLLVTSFGWSYFFFNDTLVPWYSGHAADKNVLALLFNGQMSVFFWAMILCNVVVPWLTLWSRKLRRNPGAVTIVGLFVVAGMYLERYVIVAGMTRVNELPFNWRSYVPSFIELLILAGSFGVFLLLYGLFTRIAPIIPLWEVREGHVWSKVRRLGRAQVTEIIETEEIPTR